MYLIAEDSVSIDRGNAEVFHYVSNLENFGNWFPGVISIASGNDLRHGEIGKQYMETVAIPFRGKRGITIAVVKSEMNRFIATEGLFPPVMPRMEIELKDADDGSCHVVWRMYSRNQGMLFRIMLLPLAKLVMQKRARLGVKRLKQILEN